MNMKLCMVGSDKYRRNALDPVASGDYTWECIYECGCIINRHKGLWARIMTACDRVKTDKMCEYVDSIKWTNKWLSMDDGTELWKLKYESPINKARLELREQLQSVIDDLKLQLSALEAILK